MELKDISLTFLEDLRGKAYVLLCATLPRKSPTKNERLVFLQDISPIKQRGGGKAGAFV